MLLPSALPCDSLALHPQPPAQRTTRPKLVIFAPYQPPSQPTAQSALQVSCRALHAILSGGGSSQSQPIQQQRLHSPLRSPLRERGQLRVPSSDQRPLKSSPLKPTPPRGVNKRRREECEREDVDTDIAMGSSDKENANDNEGDDGYSTPKRQRLIPLDLPRGLSAADFETLHSQPQPHHRDMDLDMPSPLSISSDSSSDWTADDDRILVETVLEKLNVSKRTWNDCARIMGRDKATLGMRWKVLVGEGNVGLRMRRGRRTERTDLDIWSW